MRSDHVLEKLRRLTVGENVNPIRGQSDPKRTISFFRSSRSKLKKMTDRDWSIFFVFIEAAVKSGSRLAATNICLSDGRFLELDKAVMGVALRDKMVSSSPFGDDTFMLTEQGWREFLKRLCS